LEEFHEQRGGSPGAEGALVKPPIHPVWGGIGKWKPTERQLGDRAAQTEYKNRGRGRGGASRP